MEVFVLSYDGHIWPKVYTTLRAACTEAGINYYSASRGKRIFKKPGRVVEIARAEVVKMRKNGAGFPNLS